MSDRDILEEVISTISRGQLLSEMVYVIDNLRHGNALSEKDTAVLREGRDFLGMLAERQRLALPPFAHLALLTADAPGRDAVTVFLERALAQGFALVAASGLRCEVYSPVAAGLARRAGLERGQALVQSAERPALHEFLPRWKALLEPTMQRRVRWTFDIDPLEFA